MIRTISTLLLLIQFEGYSQNKQQFAPQKPINSGAIIDEAVKLKGEGKYTEAIIELQKVDENDTNYHIASVKLADAYLQADRDSESVLLCDKLIPLNNYYLESIYSIKGIAFSEQKMYKESIEVLKEGLHNFPNSCLLTYDMGLVYTNMKDLKSAEEAFQKALKINPYHASSHLRIGICAFNQGKIVPAMLSMLFFLQLESSSSRSLEVINRIEEIVKGEKVPTGPLAGESTSDDFSDLESVIRSKVALNGKYKSKIKLKYDLVKQTQLMMEKLIYSQEDKGFWMQMYVPYFAALQKKGYFETMMYYVLSSAKTDDISSWNKSHASQRDQFINWASDAALNDFATFDETLNGNTGKMGHYYSGSEPEAIGNLKNKKKVGYWKYFYRTNYPMSEGVFNDNAQREGLWKYYHETGGLSEEAYFSKGELVGAYKKYHTNGQLSLKATYVKGLYDGIVETFYPCGVKKGSYNFKNGKKEGKEVTFFRNGSKKHETEVVNGVAEGKYTIFYENGGINEVLHYKNGEKEGDFKSFYDDGAKKSSGQYLKDLPVGQWTNWHNNGNLELETNLNDKGLYVGVLKKYDLNGKLAEEITYSEKGKIIAQKFYTYNGLLENELIYRKEELAQSKSYDLKGKCINDQSKVKKNFDVAFYRVYGFKVSEGHYTNDEREGEWMFYNENGGVSSTTMYSKGKMQGKYMSYYLNGDTSIMAWYKEDQLDSLYIKYFLNGKIDRQGYYVNGLEQGYWYYYFQDGTPSEIRYYLNGEEVGKSWTFTNTGKEYKEDILRDGMVVKLTYLDTNGKIINVNEFPAGTGNIVYNFPNGKPRLLGSYKGGYSEGDYTRFFANTKVESIIHYKDNEKDGTAKYYYFNGAKKSEETFVLGKTQGEIINYFENGNVNDITPYKFGEKEGLYKSYFENKAIEETCPYKNGKANGPERIFADDGQLILSKYFENERLLSVSFHNKAGKWDSIPLENETGKIDAYFQNGLKALEYETKFGFTNGAKTEYFSNGKVKLKEEQLYGYINGKRKKYYSNGNLKADEFYSYGERHGWCKYYYENGKLKEEGLFLNDSKTGSWKCYDQNGKPLPNKSYIDGVLYP